ncbi:MAG TPA: hypothetical protein VHP33_28625, partial [Polyangiaceae bacterium]|nr:hypothetical protein [Polyangiaceae bacterium]
TPADLTIAHYLRGKVTGPGATLRDLAAPDEEYPRLEWINRITESHSSGSSDESTVDLSPQLTPRFAAGVQFLPVSYEIWGTGEKPIIEPRRTGGDPPATGERPAHADRALALLRRIVAILRKITRG